MYPMTPTVRAVPPNFCGRHGQPARWKVDGTIGVACRQCMAEELRAADAVLAVDRKYHRHHVHYRMRGCPYCYPGAAA